MAAEAWWRREPLTAADGHSAFARRGLLGRSVMQRRFQDLVECKKAKMEAEKPPPASPDFDPIEDA